MKKQLGSFDGVFGQYVFDYLKKNEVKKNGESLKEIIRQMVDENKLTVEKENELTLAAEMSPLSILVTTPQACIYEDVAETVFYSLAFKTFRGKLARQSTQLYFYADNKWKALDADSFFFDVFLPFQRMAVKIENEVEEKTYSLSIQKGRAVSNQCYAFCLNNLPECPFAAWGRRFLNGVLDFESNKLIPHTSLLHDFGFVPSLSYDDTKGIDTFLSFVDSSFPNQRELLQEVLGYLLTDTNEYQKLFYIYGVAGSGKSTLAHLIGELVGKNNTTSINPFSFENKNSLGHIVDKRVAFCHEMRLGKNSDRDQITSTILAISGGDPLEVSRKYRDAWLGVLPTKLVFVSNEQANLGDTHKTLSRRCIYLSAPNSFVGKEDFDLVAKMKDELSGIFSWAVEGLKRLRKNKGVFTLGNAHKELIDEQERLNNPIIKFKEERLTQEPNSCVSVEATYKAYQGWCRQFGFTPTNVGYFSKGLGIPSVRKMFDGKQQRGYAGWRLA